MLFTILIPVGGLACLVLWAAYFVARRAKLIASERAKLEERGRHIRSEDMAAFDASASLLITTGKYADTVSSYLKTRAELLPEHVSVHPGCWESDDLQRCLASALRQKGEAINRNLFLPATVSFLGVVTATVLATAIAWATLAPQDVQPEITDAPPTETAKPFDPFDDFPDDELKTQDDTDGNTNDTRQPATFQPQELNNAKSADDGPTA